MDSHRISHGRVWLLDEARGLFILLMIVYHGAYDLVYIFNVNIPAFHWRWLSWLQLLIAGMLVFISGAASRYSRNNLKRGAICFAFGMLMTLSTWLVLPSQLIIFGVLHLLGVCMMLFGLVSRWLDRIPPAIGLIVCAALFWLTFNTMNGYWGMGPLTFDLPDALYQTNWLSILGFLGKGFHSSDYFPLLPWMFWFFGGSFAGVYLKAGQCPAWVYRPHSRALAFCGRHTMIIYLLHQPVLYVVLNLIFGGAAA